MKAVTGHHMQFTNPHALFRIFLALVLLSVTRQPAQAEIRLPKVFNSHMVMQQEKPIIVWGWANPNETVKVELGSTSSYKPKPMRAENGKSHCPL